MYDFSKKKNRKLLSVIIFVLIGTMLLTSVLVAFL